MGVDIYPFVECDFQNSSEPFSSSLSVRCINSGHFFVWRSLELFWCLGLDYWPLELPESPLVLGRIPKALGRTIVEQNAIVLSTEVDERTDSNQWIRFPMSLIARWKEEGLQYLPIANPKEYEPSLNEHETLILDPGVLLPNFASSAEIRSALDHCGVGGDKVDYFLAIVALMESMEKALSPDHVRLVYWFDFLDSEYMRSYRNRHSVKCDWPEDR